MDLPRCSAVILDVSLMGIIRQRGTYIGILIVGIRSNVCWCVFILVSFWFLLIDFAQFAHHICPSVCLW